MTTLVECWNKLDGNVGELSSWVATKDSAAPEGGSEISIEKLESQLNTLKTMFAEKQKLVSDLDAYGPAAGKISLPYCIKHTYKRYKYSNYFSQCIPYCKNKH